ncbi:MAG: hypothetical protein ACFFFC_00805 [Candidatus Thorarchaeota archaeon]
MNIPSITVPNELLEALDAAEKLKSPEIVVRIKNAIDILSTRITLPEDLHIALKLATELPGFDIMKNLKVAIDKLALMYGDKPVKNKLERNNVIVVKVEVAITYSITDSPDTAPHEIKKFWELDPSSFSSSQNQDFQKIYNDLGEVINYKKVGLAKLTLSGNILATKDESLPAQKSGLRITIDRVINNFDVIISFNNKVINNANFTKQEMLDILNKDIGKQLKGKLILFANSSAFILGEEEITSLLIQTELLSAMRKSAGKFLAAEILKEESK